MDMPDIDRLILCQVRQGEVWSLFGFGEYNTEGFCTFVAVSLAERVAGAYIADLGIFLGNNFPPLGSGYVMFQYCGCLYALEITLAI